MGSQPTLDPAPTRPPDTGPLQHPDAVEGRAELLEHLQTPPPPAVMSSATGPSSRSPAASAAT